MRETFFLYGPRALREERAVTTAVIHHGGSDLAIPGERYGDPDPAALDALTRAGLNRGGRLSDRDLVLGLASREPDSRRLKLFVEVGRLLRLMDGLVSGIETGEGFVSKFSDRFLATTTWDVEPTLNHAFERLNDFYGEIQRFSASARALADEPLLFGLAA